MEISSSQEPGNQLIPNDSGLAQTLGKDDFLSLLVTQLKNQDPLKPTDPAEFTGQLAQFSSLEQLHNINESMKALESIGGSVDRLSALSMIGKYVVTESNAFRYEGAPVELGFRFQDHVAEAAILVRNEAGQIISRIDVNEPSAGENFISWDGTDADDVEAPKGEYRFEVVGVTKDGSSLQGDTLVQSLITGVDFSSADGILLTERGEVKLSEIDKVNSSTLRSESSEIPN
jgi:flagellar basal-body rod modification protein FlgD